MPNTTNKLTTNKTSKNNIITCTQQTKNQVRQQIKLTKTKIKNLRAVEKHFPKLLSGTHHITQQAQHVESTVLEASLAQVYITHHKERNKHLGTCVYM